MKRTTRVRNYLRNASSLTATWELCSRARKKYARYLVERYGYPVRIAIQTAYIFGYDPRPYDNRLHTRVDEEMPASHFGL